jgi:hypothetical protein
LRKALNFPNGDERLTHSSPTSGQKTGTDISVSKSASFFNFLIFYFLQEKAMQAWAICDTSSLFVDL